MKRAILCTGVLFAAGVFAQPTVTLIGNNYGWVSPGSPSYFLAQNSFLHVSWPPAQGVKNGKLPGGHPVGAVK